MLSLIHVDWYDRDIGISVLEAGYCEAEGGTLFPQRSLLSFTWKRKIGLGGGFIGTTYQRTHTTKGITLKVMGFTVLKIGMKHKEGWPS